MKSVIKVFVLFSLLSISIVAQVNNLRSHSQMNLDCKTCHLCDTPTKAEPCLVQCPRYKIEPIRHSVEDAPDDIIINEVASENDLYTPVDFTHRLHAEMSLMSGGCATCHHYNPPGEIVKCSTCHESESKRTNLAIPTLKAAYHRQCMTCHTTWEEKTECKSCHELNSQVLVSKTVEPKIVKSHQKITVPVKIVYETEADEGSMVTYFHNDHTDLFNLECTDCHTQESCASCHNQKVDFAKPELDDEHDRCSSCHDTDTEDNCTKCHTDSEKKPFNHTASTKFDLQKFHAKVACISCHKSKTDFAGLNPKCENCHKSSDGYFDHSVTGLKLDETHQDFYCENCHENNKYKKSPICSDCHEDDISFPKNIPGKKVK